MSDSLAIPWTEAHQALLSIGFPRQEYWSGLPFPSLGDVPDPGIKLASPGLAGRFFTTEPPGKSIFVCALLGFHQEDSVLSVSLCHFFSLITSVRYLGLMITACMIKHL